MNETTISIAIGSLDFEDQNFAVRSFSPCDRLEASLNRHGLLHPPWVLAKPAAKYAVVDGFKRLQWARQTGVMEVGCTVFPESSEPVELLLRRIEEKLFGAPLNVAEKAQIVSKLAAHCPRDRLASEFLPRLGVSSKPETLKRWCKLAGASDALLEAAASGDISDRAALELADWEEEAAGKALGLLQDLRCSASIQMEILERITEIARRDAMHRRDMLDAPDLQGILRDLNLNHRQKTQAVRDLLTRWRLPRLRAREERFAHELAEIALPSNIRLVPPPFFEGEGWQLQIVFSAPEELQRLAQTTLRIAQVPAFSVLMNPSPKKKDASQAS